MGEWHKYYHVCGHVYTDFQTQTNTLIYSNINTHTHDPPSYESTQTHTITPPPALPNRHTTPKPLTTRARTYVQTPPLDRSPSNRFRIKTLSPHNLQLNSITPTEKEREGGHHTRSPHRNPLYYPHGITIENG